MLPKEFATFNTDWHYRNTYKDFIAELVLDAIAQLHLGACRKERIYN